MAVASMSCKIRDQSPTHAKQMLHLNERFFNDTRFSPRCFGEFDHDPESSSSPAVSVENFQQQFAGGGSASDLEKKRFPEPIALPFGTSAVSSEIAHIMQGRVASYPVSQQPSVGQESIGRGLPGDFGSLAFNEFADFWGDIRLYSQEMATAAAVLPPQRQGWIDGSAAPCTTSGDIMSTAVSVQFERPAGQRSYAIPTCAEPSAGEANDLKTPRPPQHIQSSHLPQPVGASATTSVFLNPPLIYHGPSRTSTEADEVLPLSSTSQPETPQQAMFPSLQLSTSRKSRFHSQTLAGDSVQDSAAVENFRESVDGAKVLGPRQQNLLQQELRLSMPTPPVLRGGLQRPEECGIRSKDRPLKSENLNQVKFKQKSIAKPVPRKYRRRKILPGVDMEHDEVDSVPTPLDHVQRERQRRDLMTSKIAALELLLPKSTKRDRASVVYDAIQLLKRLERDVKDLQQRFQEVQLRRAGHKQSRDPGRLSIPKSIDGKMGTSGHHFSNGIVIKRMGTYMKPVAICSQPRRGTNGKSRLTHFLSNDQFSRGSNALDKGNVFIEFHVHLDDSVTVQDEKVLKCRCRMDYLRTLVGVVDEFQLDLTSCNIIKLSGYFICIMRLRALSTADTISATQFAVRLQSMVDVDVASEAVTNSLLGATISESVQM